MSNDTGNAEGVYEPSKTDEYGYLEPDFQEALDNVNYKFLTSPINTPGEISGTYDLPRPTTTASNVDLSKLPTTASGTPLNTPQLMSDEELRVAINVAFLGNKAVEDLLDLINSQKIAWADYVIGGNVELGADGLRKSDGGTINTHLSEQRERNTL